ncbi:hypothetical protein GCM10023189_08270 [Nibrella saemangeumensis]|uniref:Uncharacterized protein n=1 Tax=Nibrella saemangeumensis TaxID=1084526 RepID=A0ABP8MGR8_9BACT
MNAQTDVIPGIYNYCNSWCERCLFTQRCQSFLQKKADEDTKNADPNASLMQQLTEALNLTKQYLGKLQQEKEAVGGHESTEAEKQALEAQAAFRRQQARQHPVSILANRYLVLTGNWLKDEKSLLEEAGQQQLQEVRLAIRSDEEAVILLNGLKDAYEVIRWYRTLIPVKTTSALRILTEPTTDSHLLNYYNGKAKLVLVSIDQSMTAWETVITFYPDKIDDVLDMLAILYALRREVEALFPEAREFKRPGLD